MTESWRASRPYVALATLAGLITAITTRFVFPHGTLDLDEVSYQAQANALRARHLTLPRGTFDPFFRPFLTGVRGDRVVFKYQPLWPALLAASDALFHSTLPLRMALSAAGVLTVAWFARELVGDRRIAIVAGALVLMSPFTWVQSASLLGYQLSLVLGTAAGAALLRALRTKSRLAGLGAGALLGLAVLHRPFDAVLAAVPVLAYVGWRAARAGGLARLTGFVALGAAPGLVALAVYNRAVMGSPLRLPFGVTGDADQFGFGWRSSFTVPGIGHEAQVHYTVGLGASTLGRVLAWFPRFLVAAPVVLALAGGVVWVRRRDARAWLLVASVVVPIVGYFFWWGTANEFDFGLEGALGPFYHYLLLPPICVAAAWGLSLWRPNRRVATVVAVVAVAWVAVFSTVTWRDARTMGDRRGRALASTSAPGRHVTLYSPEFERDPYLRFVNDNGLQDASLVALGIPGRRLELIDRFHDRAAYAVRSFHPAGDPFGHEVRERVRPVVVRGKAVTVHLRAAVPRDVAATSYLRIGRGQPRLGASGVTRIAQSWRLDPALLTADTDARAGATVMVAVGITVAPGTIPPTATTPEWYECRFEARIVAAGIEVLTPCDGFRGYLFPGGKHASVAEDVSPVVRAGIEVLTH